jgi:hypothetical protein
VIAISKLLHGLLPAGPRRAEAIALAERLAAKHHITSARAVIARWAGVGPVVIEVNRPDSIPAARDDFEFDSTESRTHTFNARARLWREQLRSARL